VQRDVRNVAQIAKIYCAPAPQVVNAFSASAGNRHSLAPSLKQCHTESIAVSMHDSRQAYVCSLAAWMMFYLSSLVIVFPNNSSHASSNTHRSDAIVLE